MGLSGKDYYVKDLVIDDDYGIIDSKATIQEAAKKMKELGVPDLVVVEESTENVLGVIGDFDIVQNVVATGGDPKTEKVIAAMYKITPVTLETPVVEAFARMRDLDVNIVPVIENGILKGVCTIQDCWSYIPDENIDDIGLIPVANTRVAEFWFASVCSIIAFIFGIILPLVGMFGFFKADQAAIMSLLGLADVRGGVLTFYLFEAHGPDFFVPIINLFSRAGVIWLLIVIVSVLLLVFGFIGLFALIYTSFADARNLRTSRIIRYVAPGLLILFMALLWILFAIGFAVATPPVLASLDGVGLIMSILSMILILAALNRDYIFRQKEIAKSIKSEVPG